jgi:hypothetical protein
LDQTDCPAPQTDLRPFALVVHAGLVYVGAVCTAESTGNPADLRAYVYSFAPQSSSFRQVLNLKLDSPRGCGDRAWQADCGGKPAEWRPWTVAPVFTTSYEVRPEPWLTDLAFDGTDLVLGLRDRFGDRRGNQAGSTDTADRRFFNGITAGDILRACSDGAGGWTPESGGACGGIQTLGAGNGQGPGNGEYYFQDDYARFGDPSVIPRHHEIALGGLVQVPGRSEVGTTVFDPTRYLNWRAIVLWH